MLETLHGARSFAVVNLLSAVRFPARQTWSSSFHRFTIPPGRETAEWIQLAQDCLVVGFCEQDSEHLTLINARNFVTSLTTSSFSTRTLLHRVYRKLSMVESPNIISIIKSSNVRWAGHVARTGAISISYIMYWLLKKSVACCWFRRTSFRQYFAIMGVF